MTNGSILITGGCGFIGTSLIKSLLDQNPNAAITVFDDLSVGSPEDLAQVTKFERADAADATQTKGVTLIEGDIKDYKAVEDATRGVSAIVHLAANTGVGPSVDNPRADLEANVIGTFNLLEAARKNGVKKFVFASSGAPIGEVEPPIHEELAPRPVSPYGASKLAGEGYCSAYYRTFGIETVALRFGNVYGPRSSKKSSVVAKFIRQALAGETCEIYGDGTQTRDFIYIEDLVRAIRLGLDSNVGGEVFQIATGSERTVTELAQLIREALTQRGISMSLEYTEPRLGDIKRNYSDTTKAKQVLGWETEMDLNEGINTTIDYFLAQKSV